MLNLPAGLTTYYVQPLRSGITRNARVAYAADRLPKLVALAAHRGDVLADLLETFDFTQN
jgi:hypothetical protein